LSLFKLQIFQADWIRRERRGFQTAIRFQGDPNSIGCVDAHRKQPLLLFFVMKQTSEDDPNNVLIILKRIESIFHTVSARGAKSGRRARHWQHRNHARANEDDDDRKGPAQEDFSREASQQ
jgi:hypothetical protein